MTQTFRPRKQASWLLCWSFLIYSALSSQAASPKFTTVLYGASYYHEYMPYERLEKDVELMQQAGVSVVRLGESTWSSWEPNEGQFEFAWMDRIIDRLHKADIKVILGTPTYSIPPWLYHKHPEILVTKLGEVKSFYGPRQNMDITHPTYLFYSERIIRQLVAHYKDHPAIIGYQIDNETSSYGTAGRNVQIGFVGYLKKKFSSVQELNKLWGLIYWGQLIQGWDEFPSRDGILNPGYKLEWERYQQQITTDFLAWQARIVNEYKRPDQFIVHNFVGGARTDIDQFAIAKSLDIAGVNPYHEVQEWLDGQSIAFNGDLCRSLKRQNYLITETNAQTIGWDSKWQRPPYDGQLRLNVYSHISSGANMIAYWHWHSLHYGQETYWKGVLGHDLEPNRVYREMTRVGQELKRLGSQLANFKIENQVALLYSVDSYQGIRFMPFHDKIDYMSILYQLYQALYQANVGVDVVFPKSEADLSQYKVIVVPPLYISDDALLHKLSDYVANGGHLLLTMKSGFCNEYSTVRWERAPGPLRKAAGFSYQEFSSIWGDIPLKNDPFHAGEQNKVSAWCEFLLLEGAKPLAYYDHPFYGQFPAIVRNQFGKGMLTYEGTALSDVLQQKVIADVLQAAGMSGSDQQLPAQVRVKKGTSNSGKVMRYYLNYSSEAKRFVYPYNAGKDLLADKLIKAGQELNLLPWDLMIVEEQ